MATVYVSTTGNDANSYAQAQSPATPWAHPLKANASATAGDTVAISGGGYLADTYTGAPTFHSFSKLLSYIGTDMPRLTASSALYTARISASMPTGTFSFSGIEFDARNIAAKAIEFGDPGALVWNSTHTNCKFSNPTVTNYNLLVSRVGAFTTSNCEFSGSPSDAAITGSGSMAAGGTLTILHTNPRFNISRNGAIAGVKQQCSAAPNPVSFIVDGATGTIETTSAVSAVQGIFLQCPGAKVRNTNGLTVKAPAANTGASVGIYIYPDAVNMTGIEVTGNRLEFACPAGYGISYGDTATVATGSLTGGVVDGNFILGAYYSNKTPHGILAGRATTVASMAGNTVDGTYANYLASRTTSGSGYGNLSKNSYGVDYYTKGATAFTWAGNTAVQTGKYPRRTLAPFSVDSQGGVLNVACSMLYNTFICAEPDFARVGALANITVNNSATYTGNTYIIPDTWDTNATDRFFVGGAEGGRSGATGYTIDEWITGTAGSVSATNGTGTIAISGERVIRLPISKIKEMLGISAGEITGSKITGRRL